MRETQVADRRTISFKMNYFQMSKLYAMLVGLATLSIITRHANAGIVPDNSGTAPTVTSQQYNVSNSKEQEQLKQAEINRRHADGVILKDYELESIMFSVDRNKDCRLAYLPLEEVECAIVSKLDAKKYYIFVRFHTYLLFNICLFNIS